MANIPELPQSITPNQAPGVRESVDVNPNAFGAGIAQGLERVAGATENEAVRAAAMANYSKITQARLQFETAVDQKAQTDWFNRKNVDASGLPQDAQDFIAKTRQETTNGMNSYQLREFDRQTLRYQRGMQMAAERHSREQLFNFSNATSEQAQLKARQGAAAQYTDPELLACHEQENNNAISISNDLNGRKGDVADEYALQSQTKYHVAVAQAFQNANRPQDGAKYLEEHKDQIDPTVHGPLIRQLKAESDISQAQATTTNLVKLHGDDYDGAIKEARATLDGPIQDHVVQRLKAQQEESDKAKRELEAQGRTKLFDWVSKGNNLLNLAPADANQMGLSPADQLHFAEMQSAAATKGHKDIDDLVDQSHALTDKVTKFDPTADDSKHTQLRSLQDDILRLHLQNAAAAAPVQKLLGEKLNPDQGIDKDIHHYMYYGDKGGGESLQAQIYDDVKAGAAAHWYNPSTWGEKEPTPEQIDARSRTILQQVKAAVKKNPDWTVDDVQAYYDKSPQVQQMKTDSLIGHWHNVLKLGGEAPGQSKFDLDALKKKE